MGPSIEKQCLSIWQLLTMKGEVDIAAVAKLYDMCLLMLMLMLKQVVRAVLESKRRYNVTRNFSVNL